MYFELSYDTVHSYNTNQLLINLSFIYLLSEIGCTQPKNPDNAKLNCFGSFCTIQCDPNKKLFKMAFYVSCSTTTLTWGEIPDCVGKLPISFFVRHFITIFFRDMTKKSFSTSILHGKVRILSCSYIVRDHIYIYIYSSTKLSFPKK